MKRFATMLLAPAVAIVFAVVISSVVLLASGNSPTLAYSQMWHFGTRVDSVISMVNRAVPLYLSACAVAIGFKMGLFNIGVEGQYRLAALFAAAAGAAVHLPAPLHVAMIIVIAVAVGATWSGIAGVLKVTRGIHEVIATIMLNAIATGLGAYFLAQHFKDKAAAGLVTKTKELPKSGQMPSLNRVLTAVGIDESRLRNTDLHGFLIGAIVAGVLFWVLVNRTRFGYELRASGMNPFAARVSGVNPKAMVVRTMLISGAFAGLVGLPQLLGFFHNYGIDFTTGFGFTGIGVALLGRNHPVGMAFGALLFGFMDRAALILDLNRIPKEIVAIMQGTILLSVVIAYEVVRRMVQAQEVRAAARAAESRHDTPEGVAA